jgi:hypothetical protein
VDELGRAFLNLAVERGLLGVEARDQVEAACARAAGERHKLTPWRAAFVRGLLSRAQVDELLADAGAKLEQRDGDSSNVLLGSESDDGALDLRLGSLALQTRVITDKQFEQAVEAQRRERTAGGKVPNLGEALVSEGIVSPAVLEGLEILQERIREAGRQDSRSEAIAADLRFGQVALDARLLSERDLDRALAEQRRRAASRGRPLAADAGALGTILVEIGALSREARDLVLELQERRSTRPAAPPPRTSGRADESDKLGRMLVDSRVASEQQVEAALVLQSELRVRGIDRKVGDLLVLQGVLDRPMLDTFLRTQAVRRKHAPFRRRRSFDELLPEHPLTVLVGTAVALGLILIYLAAIDGFSLLRGAGR